MKCFRIDCGGEFFYWAGESSGDVLAEFRDNYDDFSDPAQIAELTDDQMAVIEVRLENEREEPDGVATLRQVFLDETKLCIGGAFELCGSVS